MWCRHPVPTECRHPVKCLSTRWVYANTVRVIVGGRREGERDSESGSIRGERAACLAACGRFSREAAFARHSAATDRIHLTRPCDRRNIPEIHADFDGGCARPRSNRRCSIEGVRLGARGVSPWQLGIRYLGTIKEIDSSRHETAPRPPILDYSPSPCLLIADRSKGVSGNAFDYAGTVVTDGRQIDLRCMESGRLVTSPVCGWRGKRRGN